MVISTKIEFFLDHRLYSILIIGCMIYFVISHPLIGVVILIYLDCNLNYASQVIYININAIISVQVIQ